jgi:tetrathionate reductase subunit B
MEENEQPEKAQRERRDFLAGLGSVIAGAIAAAAGAVPPQATAAAKPAIPGYDWTKHRWAFGVDATKCIGCLRCVEACKRENDVPADAHHFRTLIFGV